MLVAGVLCGIASVICAAFGWWSLRRVRAAGAELPTRSVAPTQWAAAVMLAAGGAVTLAAPGSGTVVLVGMCVVGAVGTIAAGSWQGARYALRRQAALCAGDCAACPLSGNQISCG